MSVNGIFDKVDIRSHKFSILDGDEVEAIWRSRPFTNRGTEQLISTLVVADIVMGLGNPPSTDIGRVAKIGGALPLRVRRQLVSMYNAMMKYWFTPHVGGSRSLKLFREYQTVVASMSLPSLVRRRLANLLDEPAPPSNGGGGGGGGSAF